MKGFKENGFEVYQCRIDPKITKGMLKYWKLLLEYQKLKKNKFDVVIVGFPGHTVVWLAYFIWGRTFIFDAFLSLYDSNVEDRKKYSKYSLGAFRDFFLDWYSIRLAKWVLLDTYAHIDYFTEQFSANRKKCIRVLISAFDDVFFRREERLEKGQNFVVHFHGTFIPLQGIPYIIAAADILRNENIIFNIIGKGQEFENIKALVLDKKLEKTVIFLGQKPLNELPLYMANSDVCLGVFGNTNKTKRTISNKVFEAVASCKPIITAMTPGVLEVFKDDTMIFCKTADPESLVEKIRWVKQNREAARLIAENAYNLFKQKLSPAVVVKELIETLGLTNKK